MVRNDDLSMHCKYCDKPIRGRMDKRFCDDHCRNYYHNHSKMEDQKKIREVNSILQKNRNILRSFYNARKFRVKKATLSQLGYRFEFHTHRDRIRNRTRWNIYDHSIEVINTGCFRISRSAPLR